MKPLKSPLRQNTYTLSIYSLQSERKVRKAVGSTYISWYCRQQVIIYSLFIYDSYRLAI